MWTHHRVNKFIQLIDKCLFCCLEVKLRAGCLELRCCKVRCNLSKFAQLLDRVGDPRKG